LEFTFDLHATSKADKRCQQEQLETHYQLSSISGFRFLSRFTLATDCDDDHFMTAAAAADRENTQNKYLRER